MLIKQWLIGKEQNINRNSGIWNAIASGINSAQSAIILVFISHCLDMYLAGIFSIAFATAILFWSINRYGVRNYQVTDSHEQFSFSDYLWHRKIVTCFTAILLLIYIFFLYFFQNTSIEKVFVVFELSILKLWESVEDVYLGRYQQQGRLDVGAKIMALRLISSTIVICILIYMGAGIYLSIFGGIIISVVVDVYAISKTFYITNTNKEPFKIKNVIHIFKLCASLCIGTTLAIYIGNIPKYMIDSYMSDEVQAIFGYIMMPVFVITVLNQFIYQPMIKNLGDLWGENKINELNKKIIKQCLLISGLIVFMLAVGVIIGLPILSYVYNANLEIYVKEFCVLLLGGGLYAMAGYFTVIMTIIRKQNYIAYGYIVVVVLALLSGKYFMVEFGMMGAALMYVLINMILVLIYGIVVMIGIRHRR
ncbi:MAG: hypothetical protein NC428_00810 [Clostridium sp.]|nr:hypothetical protein [Clostridium sp.]